MAVSLNFYNFLYFGGKVVGFEFRASWLQAGTLQLEPHPQPSSLKSFRELANCCVFNLFEFLKAYYTF
jgi:hypothetical protein